MLLITNKKFKLKKLIINRNKLRHRLLRKVVKNVYKYLLINQLKKKISKQINNNNKYLIMFNFIFKKINIILYNKPRFNSKKKIYFSLLYKPLFY